MRLLILSILALVVGPAVHRMARHRTAMLRALDGFVLVAVGGLVLVQILPECVADGGWWAIAFAFAGLWGPTVVEKYLHRAERQVHSAALFLALLGISLHALLDGAALVEQHGPQHRQSVLLGWAVVLHNIPVGLTIWWLLSPGYGARTASGVLALVAGATLGGFWAGEHLTEGLSLTALAWFQALVAGSLMHVLIHRSIPHSREARDKRQADWPSGIGATVGIVLVLGLMGTEELFRTAGLEVARAFSVLALESAPALLLGYVAAGLLNAFLPPSPLHWLASGGSFNQSFKGMIFGLPLPICSCGVVPLYRALVHQRVPATAAIAFLIATPELGVDAVLLSVPLLGLEMAGIRVAGAMVVALLVGWLVGIYAGRKGLPVTPGDASALAPASGQPFRERLKRGTRFGLEEVVDHTAPWILLGLAVAAFLDPLLQEGWLHSLPARWEVVVFAFLGIPIYVCASGATPLVAVLMQNGVSPGAVLAFLLTGPATNITTFGLLGQLHGRRVALVFSAAIAGVSIALGYLVNLLYPGFQPPELFEREETSPSRLQLISLILLGFIFLSSWLRQGPRGFARQILLFDEQRGDGPRIGQ